MPKPTGAVPAAPLSPLANELYRQVSALPESELCTFLLLMVRDTESLFGQFFNAICKSTTNRQKTIDSLLKKLARHRKPKKNAERDAEIMRLHGEGKTAGQIALALSGRWKLTDKAVNAVISRERRKLKAKQSTTR